MNPAPARPTTVLELMNLLVSNPGRPRLTWYGDDGERVELSGAVLQNWVNKTTNLFVEEFDAAPGARVLIDVPPHWRSVVWALAAWRCGATVVLGHREDAADVVVTSRPGAHAGARDLVAVALPALARRFEGDLPAGAVDAASAVMTYADQVLWAPETDPAEAALEADGETVVHGELFAWPGAADLPVDGPRVLVDGDGEPAAVLRATLGAWLSGGSVVLTSAATARELREDAGRLARIRSQEGVTAP